MGERGRCAARSAGLSAEALIAGAQLEPDVTSVVFILMRQDGSGDGDRPADQPAASEPSERGHAEEGGKLHIDGDA